jgi:hypothetical protein
VRETESADEARGDLGDERFERRIVAVFFRVQRAVTGRSTPGRRRD